MGSTGTTVNRQWLKMLHYFQVVFLSYFLDLILLFLEKKCYRPLLKRVLSPAEYEIFPTYGSSSVLGDQASG